MPPRDFTHTAWQQSVVLPREASRIKRLTAFHAAEAGSPLFAGIRPASDRPTSLAIKDDKRNVLFTARIT
jgi:hypothetical protein